MLRLSVMAYLAIGGVIVIAIFDAWPELVVSARTHVLMRYGRLMWWVPWVGTCFLILVWPYVIWVIATGVRR